MFYGKISYVVNALMSNKKILANCTKIKAIQHFRRHGYCKIASNLYFYRNFTERNLNWLMLERFSIGQGYADEKDKPNAA